MLFKSLFTTALIFTNVAMAQTSAETVNLGTDKKIAVYADVTSVLLKGAGVKALYALTPNFSVGGLVYKYQLKNSLSNSSFFNPVSDVIGYGVVTSYFFNPSHVGGVYLSAAYTHNEVETKAEGSLANGAAANDTQNGLQAKGGYQFAGDIFSGNTVMFQVGLGYGVGGGIESSADSLQNAQTEMKSSLLLDLALGTNF